MKKLGFKRQKATSRSLATEISNVNRQIRTIKAISGRMLQKKFCGGVFWFFF